jgi:hypothetical protein
LEEVTAFLLSWALPTLLRGSAWMAYDVPPSATSSARNATAIGGEGRSDMMRRMWNLLVMELPGRGAGLAQKQESVTADERRTALLALGYAADCRHRIHFKRLGSR